MLKQKLTPSARNPMLRSEFCASLLCFASLLTSAAIAEPQNTYWQKTRAFYSPQEFNKTAPNVRLVRDFDRNQLCGLMQFAIPIPSNDFTVLNQQSPSVWWFGTKQGAFRL